MIVMVRLHHYAYGACDYCPDQSIVHCSVVAEKWICHACIVRLPHYHQMARASKIQIHEEYLEAELQLGKRGLLPVADVPLERMRQQRNDLVDRIRTMPDGPLKQQLRLIGVAYHTHELCYTRGTNIKPRRDWNRPEHDTITGGNDAH